MHLQDVRLVGGGCCMDFIEMVQNKDKWRTLVNGVMELGVASYTRNFLTSWNRLAFQEWLCSMK